MNENKTKEFKKSLVEISVLNNMAGKFLNNIDCYNSLEVFEFLDKMFGEYYKDEYIAFFKKRPDVFDGLTDINLKLKLSKYRFTDMSELERETEVLKYEWDKSNQTTLREIEQMNWIKDFLMLVINDMKMWAKEDNCEDTKVRYISEGAYFQVYEIGNHMLKLGNKKYSDNSNFSRNYIVANLSREFSDSYTIEVVPYTFTRKYEDIEVYSLYEQEREIGNCWADSKSNNIGMLISDNIPRYTNLSLLGYQYLGIQKEIENYKKKGELVIIDRDYSYSLSEYDIDTIIKYKSGTVAVGIYENLYQKRLKK